MRLAHGDALREDVHVLGVDRGAHLVAKLDLEHVLGLMTYLALLADQAAVPARRLDLHQVAHLLHVALVLARVPEDHAALHAVALLVAEHQRA